MRNNLTGGAENSSPRNEKIDLLRFLGLSMIILAHIKPPFLLFQLRNFDVPLMVFVSGASYAFSFKSESYRSYLWKRIKRLLFPVWIFLTVCFAAFFLLSYAGFTLAPLGAREVLSSYALLSGIGFVWIIRVFLMVAMIAPFIYRLNSKVDSDRLYFTILLVIYMLHEVIRNCFFSWWAKNAESEIFESIVLYAVPYSIAFAVGLRLCKCNEKNRSLIPLSILLFGGVFCALCMMKWVAFGRIEELQRYKYPPGMYYLFYALFVSCVLWFAGDLLVKMVNACRIDQPVMFIARNSLWIYLWHIPVVTFAAFVPLPYYIRYVLVFGVAVLIVFTQVAFVNRLERIPVVNRVFKKNLRTLFTG